MSDIKAPAANRTNGTANRNPAPPANRQPDPPPAGATNKFDEFGIEFTDTGNAGVTLNVKTVKEMKAAIPGMEFYRTPLVNTNGTMYLLCSLNNETETIFLSTELVKDIADVTGVELESIVNSANNERFVVKGISKDLDDKTLANKKKEVNRQLRAYEFKASECVFYLLDGTDGPYTVLGKAQGEMGKGFGDWAE